MSDRRLRIATYNIHGGRPAQGPANLRDTAAVVASLLDGGAPALVGLQEVHHYLPTGVWQDQPRQLRRLLGCPVVFRRSFGAGITGYGNALASTQQPDRVRRHLLPSRGEQRSVLEAHLPLWGESIRVLVTHFGLEAEERYRQAQTLCALIRAEALPTLVLGDLNAAPDSPPLELLAEEGLRHAAPVELLTFPSDTPKERIDYLLHDGRFAPLAGTGHVVCSAASDHAALAADVLLQ